MCRQPRREDNPLRCQIAFDSKICASWKSMIPLGYAADESRNGERQPSKSNEINEGGAQVLDAPDSNLPPVLPSYAPTAKSPCPATSPSSFGSKLRLSLNRFAFIDSSASVPTATAQRGPTSSDEKPKGSRRRKPLLSAINASEAALSRLTGCVCCQTKWTVKKTAAQKLNHMDACSKKRSYSPETMSFLIKKELNTAEKAAMEGAEINTHLQSILQDARSKKKRRNDGPTVQQFTHQTRETILKRARTILGPSVNLDESDAFLDLPVSTQAVVPCQSVTSTGVAAWDMSFRPSTLR
ncbi:hypothetical protein AGABI2DRAFT_117181 [Agaricus bisporus var. bisporus H97]|uniref:hypothetical protein n=1 Tax=Agaricus bisporus var. bisporus (strain H97 / ATCC MYA-4626 / FGSC 10389) TaxID=936046 RepID=UPI00029F789A|nr:hypothetical protein AGABI2DRAFT_117181 [Agaricus bisporus var. bisporus H97]EKV48360.1 hypothetical protein AGABI2DRAFT_117181 [Agaricus bisporus var. bisporus H97]